MDCSKLDKSFAKTCINIHNLFFNCRRDDRFTKGNLFEHAVSKLYDGEVYEDENLSDVCVGDQNISCKIVQLEQSFKSNGSASKKAATVAMNNVMNTENVNIKQKNLHNDLYLFCVVSFNRINKEKTVYFIVLSKGCEDEMSYSGQRQITLSFDPGTKEYTRGGRRSMEKDLLCYHKFTFSEGGEVYDSEFRSSLKKDIFDLWLSAC